MHTDFLESLQHSWGKSPKQKAREKEYNAEYYRKHKDKWTGKRPRARKKNKVGSYGPDGTFIEYTNGKGVERRDADRQTKLSMYYNAMSNRDAQLKEIRDTTKEAAMQSLSDAIYYGNPNNPEYNHELASQAASLTLQYADLGLRASRQRAAWQHGKDEAARLLKKKGTSTIPAGSSAYKPKEETPDFIPLVSKKK